MFESDVSDQQPSVVSLVAPSTEAAPRIASQGRGPHSGSMRWAIALVLTALSFVLLLEDAVTNSGQALFTSQTSVAGNTFQTKQIFPGARSTAAWDLRDDSSGSEANSSDTLSFADGLITTTGNWATSFASNRYLDFDYNSPLPGGLSVSSITFDFRMVPSVGSETACYYFEVRRASTGVVLGTHGSSSSPVACVTGSTYGTTSTSIAAEVTTTDIANDLRIRMYGKNSASHAMKIDMAVVPGSTSTASFTLYPTTHTDASTGTASTAVWSLATADSVTYTAAQNWPGTCSPCRYLKVTFPAYLPSSATVTQVTLSHIWGGHAVGRTWSMYFEVYQGTTLLATHGSSSSPYSTRTDTALSTDTSALTEVDSAAKANNVVIKFYIWTSSGGQEKTVHDQVAVSVNYYLN